MTRLILASGSAARQKMLRESGLRFDVAKADIDERALEARWASVSSADLALKLAAEKARSVAQNHPGAVIIGADQTLDIGGDLIHKAKTLDAAADTLLRLSGKSHRLTSAAVIMREGRIRSEHVGHVTMTMRDLSEAEISRYLAGVGHDILSSVGCYHIEGAGVHLFEDISGDLFSIMGLPLLSLLAGLRAEGLEGF